ncbi:cation transporter [Bathymodiolus septemdierum thioautotrophic gill symbiont]|uniref:Co/Zn/Cd efflux system component n=1 Tax=endosymbiont of Bathymodiolus septemdierum str. Myojin knoll TaxID=1303921 RepID=A0A0P0UQL0_9GAMM|nr:cation diffusion facilitator family transporter [Bathymodiolus septemdierum thioautotrophic gill symbiont]BAS67357.1 Co/Zn/Cd efflux system component [endosymbiont of Bathymodiolus septemdierum str. Myojin knoll]
MGCDCGNVSVLEKNDGYRRILWWVLFINASLFVIEIIFGFYAGSQSLLGDALDFFGDSINYAISLYVLDKALSLRAKASLVKGITMGMFGLWVLGSSAYKAIFTSLPQAEVMGVVGVLALFANLACALLLYQHRSGDSNRESVWICSRNDAIGNIAVIFASIGVLLTHSNWPDLLVAVIIASLALSGAWRIIKSARTELVE